MGYMLVGALCALTGVLVGATFVAVGYTIRDREDRK